jgi:hypothetical protein
MNVNSDEMHLRFDRSRCDLPCHLPRSEPLASICLEKEKWLKSGRICVLQLVPFDEFGRVDSMT